MITEDYVSFETAKLLKKKGFDMSCEYFGYNIFDSDHRQDTIENFSRSEAPHLYIPTISQARAMKWLREVHNVNPVPYALSLGWAFDVFDLSSRDITGCKKLYSMDFPSKSEVYNTYEQACEASIKYCLENLI